MNDFLIRIKDIIKDNPHLLEGNLKDFLYTQLITYNLGKGEPLKNIEPLFDDWVYRNKNKDNIKTFVNPNRPYFCQFVNSDAKNITGDAIKLYIPLNENRLYEGANRLFDFIAKEGICHNSKIAKKIRNDNIVVRVSNIDEAMKVVEFVKNDPYIQDGLMNTNPFTINVDGVGIAKDGLRSYNTELCNHLVRFINILVSKDRLDDLNITSFHEYLDTVKDFGDNDLQMITKIQSEVTRGNKLSLDDFNNIINGSKVEIKDSKEEIFKNVVKLTYQKYGMTHTINAIARFRYNGYDGGFTRDKGARYELTLNRISPDDVNKFLENDKLLGDNSIESYINDILGKNNDYNYLVSAYNETYNKHGKEQADYAIKEYIFKGELKYLTNNNNARNNLKRVDYNKIHDILKEGLNIDSYSTLEELSISFLEEMNKNYKNYMRF